MAFLAGPGSRWGKSSQQSAARTMAMVGLAGGVCTVLAGLFPPNEAAPVETLRIVGALTLAAAGAFWLIGERMPVWGLHLAVALSTLAISVVVAATATGLGMVVSATAYLWICVFAGFFFPLWAARAHMAWIAVCFGAALLIGDAFVPVNAWIFISVSLVVAGETVGRQSARLRHEAQTDPLTGLLNRKGLGPAAERALALADRTGIPLTVALIDLDDFKATNDRKGHAAGDRLLAELARIWTEEIDPNDILARLGGDEFLLVLVGSSRDEAARLFQRLHFISPTPWSAGVIRREGGEDLSTLMAKADGALYESKRAQAARRGERVLQVLAR